MRPRPILLFDFDGTIALGDGPVLAYARAVAAQLAGGGTLVDEVIAEIADGTGALDGYDAVRRAAESLGATAEHLSAAYLTSRAQLATEHAPITAPAGLAEFLAESDAECILVTNAPHIRLDQALEELGLSGCFARIISNAEKPGGLEAVLDSLPPDAPVLSVGDIWRNDLEPVYRRGHATALVGGFEDPDARPLLHAESLSALLPQIAEWLRAPHLFSPSEAPAHLPPTAKENHV